MILVLAGMGQQAQAAPPTLEIEATPDIVGAGGSTALTFTIDNSLQLAVSDVDFTLPLPSAPGQVLVADSFATTSCTAGTITAATGATSIVFTDGALDRDTSCTVTVNVTLPAVGLYTFPQVTLTSSAGSPTATSTFDVTASAPPTTPLASFDFVISDAVIDEGGTTTATYTMANISATDRVGSIRFDHTLPAGVVIATPSNASTTCEPTGFGSPFIAAIEGSQSIQFSLNGGNFNDAFAALLVGESCSVTIDLVGDVAGGYSLTPSPLTADTQSIPPTTRSLTVSEIIVPTDVVTIDKAFASGTVAPGATVDLTFTLGNANATDGATNVSFTDDLDAFLTGAVAVGLPVSNVCGTGSTITGTSTLSLSGGAIPARGTCSFTVTVQVPGSAAPGTYTNTTSAVQAQIGGGALGGTDTATDTIDVLAALPLTFSRAFTPDAVAGGDPLVLTYTITNPNAGSTATDITFVEDFSARFGNLSGFTGITTTCGASSTITNLFISDFNGSSLVGFTFAGGELAPGASCTFSATSTVPVDSPSGPFSSTSSDLTATISGQTITTPGQTDTLTVNAGATVTLSGAVEDTLDGVNDGRVVNGSQFDVALTITNGPESQAGITAAGFTYNVSSFGTGTTAAVQSNTCSGTAAMDGASQLLTVSGAAVPVDDSCTVTVRVTAQGGTNISASASTSVLDYTAGGAPGQSPGTTTSIIIGTALPVTTSHEFNGGATALAGETIVLTYSFDNLNAATAATSVTFTHNLGGIVPGLARVSTVSDTCGFSTVTGTTFLIASGGTVPVSGSCALTVDVAVPVGAGSGSFTSQTSDYSATYGSAGTLTTPFSETVLTIDNEPLGFTMAFVDDPVAPGADVTVEFTLDNPLAAALSNAAFSLSLNSAIGSPVFANSFLTNTCGGTDSTSGTGTITYSGGSLGAGGSCTISLLASIPAGSNNGNFAHTTSGLSATAGALTVGADPASDTLTVNSLSNATFTASFAPASTIVGGTTSITYTIENGGSSALNDLAFSHDIGGTLQNTAATGLPLSNICGSGSSVSGTDTVSFTGGTLAPGANCSFSVDLLVPVTATTGANPTATSQLFVNGLPIAEPATDSLTLTGAADLAVTVDNAATTIVAGNSTVYTVSVTNNGPSEDPAATLTSTVDAGATCTYTSTASGGATGNTASGSGNLSETLSLPFGASVDYTVACLVPASATGSVTYAASSATSAGVTSLVPGNDSASDTDSISQSADLAVTLSDTADPVFPNGTTTYSAAVSNAGPSDVADAVATFTLPTGFSLTSTTGCAEDPNGVATCTLGAVAAGGNANFTVAVTADATTTGTQTASVSVAATEPDPDTTNNSATETTTVAPQADLSITKSDGVTSVISGQNVVYTIVAENAGPSAEPGATISDTFPATLTCSYTSVAAGGATGNTASGSGNLSDTVALPVGGSVTYTATCLVDPNATGTLSNTATITASVDDPDAANNSATDGDTAVTPLTFDFTKSFAPAAVNVGQTSRLTLVVDNTGNTLTATGMAFTDPLPAGMVLAADPEAQNTCGGTLTAPAGAASLSLAGGNVAGGASCSVDVTVVTSAPGSLANTTSALTSTFPNAGPAVANLAVNPAGAPTFAKAFDAASVAQGETAILTFDIDNSLNSVPVTGMDFVDIFPAGMVVADTPAVTNTCGGNFSAVPGASSVSLRTGAVAALDACSIDVTVRAVGAGALLNIAGDLVSNLPTASGPSATLNSVPAALVFTKEFAPATVPQGQSSTITFSIDNSANAIDATGMAFTNTLSGGLIVASPAGISNTCGGTVTAPEGGTSIALSAGTLAASGSCEISLAVRAVDAGTITDTASVLTSSLADVPGASATLTVIPVAAPGFTKNFGNTSLFLGETTPLVYTIDNTGNTIVATDLAFSDTLPAGLELVSSPAAGSGCGGTLTAAAGSQAITFGGGSVAAGGTCQITVVVEGVTIGTFSNGAPVLTSGNLPDATAVLLGGSATVTVEQQPLVAAMAFSPSTIEQNLVSTLTYTLTNPATTDATAVTLSDTLPASLSIAAAPAASTSCSGTLSAGAGGSSVGLTGGTLAAGSSCTISVSVTSPDVGSLTNSLETLTSSLGPSSPVSATLQVTAVVSGTVTVVQQTDTDGSYGFTSSEPLLNFTITAAGGAGQAGPIRVPAGSYVVNQSVPAGVGNASISCNDADSGGDAFARTLTLNLSPGEAVTCTISSSSTQQKTVDVINQFLTKRADLILSSEPSSGRRFDRLSRGSGSSSPLQFSQGDVQSFLPFTAQIDTGANNYSFSTSLLQARQAVASLELAHGSTKDTLYVENHRRDIWFEAQYKEFDLGDDGSGHFGIVYAGVDYLVNPDTLVGVMLQFDDMKDSSAVTNSSVSGTGWMIGPYVTARIGERLYFDGRIAAGRSENDISPNNTYTDEFTTNRWLIKAALSGEFQKGAWTIRPNASLSYFEETQNAYTDSLNVPIPSQTVKLGQIQVGPTFTGNFSTPKGTIYKPYIGLDALYNYGDTSGVRLSATDETAAVEGLRGRIRSGVHVNSDSGTRFSLGWSYDGIGQSDYETWGVELKLSIPLPK
ncbi:autotransporter domain-containing protein [Roseovarius sp. 2305UL8-3]|uniref:DUF7933 domain-containing protein n=1 Tax=Roseovarius conchicola TaxID=3121636 RepID=UPI0035294371